MTANHANITMTITEKYVHPVYGRIFETSFSSDTGNYPTAIRGIGGSSLTSGQAIACKVAAEKAVWQYKRTPKMVDGNPVAISAKLTINIVPL